MKYMMLFSLSSCLLVYLTFPLTNGIDLYTQDERSLVFVMDVTGSMSGELHQVKTAALNILNDITNSSEITIKDFIFIPFNDPGVGPFLHTKNLTEFKIKLKDVRVGGGGDCPEMCLTALEIALNRSLPKSHIFVFTDAGPKDTHLLPKVLTLIQMKRSRVLFILTGDCGIISEEYKKIALVSMGQIFDIRKNDVSLISDFIKIGIRPHSEKLFSIDVDRTADTWNTWEIYNISIDNTLNDIILSVSGKISSLHLTNVKGNEISKLSDVSQLIDLQQAKVIKIQAPKFEELFVNVSSDNPYSLSITAMSILSFEYGFSLTNKWSKYMDDFSKLPFEGVLNFLYVKPSFGDTPNNNSKSTHVTMSVCELASLNGSIIDVVALHRVKESQDNTYCGVINSTHSKEPFYLKINGKTEQGVPLQRIVSAALQLDPKAIVVSIPESGVLYVNESSKLSCYVESTQPVDVLWTKNGEKLNITEHFEYTRGGFVDLQIPGVSFNDEGNYTCVVIRKDGDTITKWKQIMVTNATRPDSNSAPKNLFFPIFLFCSLFIAYYCM